MLSLKSWFDRKVDASVREALSRHKAPDTLRVADLAERWGVDKLSDVRHITRRLDFPMAANSMMRSLAFGIGSREIPSEWRRDSVERWEQTALVKRAIRDLVATPPTDPRIVVKVECDASAAKKALDELAEHPVVKATRKRKAKGTR